MSNDFAPTHRITLWRQDGTTERILVMLDQDGSEDGACGPAYTQEEWDASAQADWEVSPEDGWTFQGRATPGGWDTVEVERL
jgi:hypothetical protein